MGGWILAVVVAGASCYSAPQPACGFVCGPNSECPNNYACNSADSRCHLLGSTESCANESILPDASPDAYLPAPMVVSTIPANGATGVVRTAAISATFDEDVGPFDATTFGVVFGGEEDPMYPRGTYSYDATSFTASFVPDSPLPDGAELTAYLETTISNDLHVPLSSDYLWNFVAEVDAAPMLVSSVPMNLDVNVDPASMIVVTFSVPVMNVNTTNFVVQGATQIAGTISSTDAITYTFTPTAALPAASVIVVILYPTITDGDGDPLAIGSFSFTTM